jgi:hypothetical protein
MIRIVSLPAGAPEYGFLNKKIAHRIMHPTEATTPNKEYFDFNERPPVEKYIITPPYSL